MSQLNVQTNAMDQRIFSRDGRLLCSPRNPEKEAGDWLQRQKLNCKDTHLVVLGLGAAFHIRALLKDFPESTVQVIELDPDLISKHDFSTLKTVSVHQDPSTISTLFNAVLPFRPAWAGFEKEYLDIYIQLNQRSPKALLAQAERQGLVLTSSWLETRLEKMPFSLRHLDFTGEEGMHDEIKMWRCLRELVE